MRMWTKGGERFKKRLGVGLAGLGEGLVLEVREQEGARRRRLAPHVSGPSA